MGGSVRYYVSKTVGLSCAVSRSFIQCFYTVGWVTDFQPVKIFPLVLFRGKWCMSKRTERNWAWLIQMNLENGCNCPGEVNMPVLSALEYC